MLNLNKNKLIPATEIIAYWGEIKGDISKQTDLVELTTDLDTSIKGWVTSQGYLTEHQDLSDYALKTEIPSLDGYATKTWVSEQGYLTEHQDLTGYATESWVKSQSYLTSLSLTGYATESWVTSQGYITSIPDTYATKTWVSSQDYLTSLSLTGYATESWVTNQGYITSIPETYATKDWVSDQGYLTSLSLTGYATESWVESKGYLTEHQDLSDYAQKSEIEPLYNKSEGYLKYVPGITYLEGMSNAGYDIFQQIENTYRANNLVNRIYNRIYAYNPYEGRFLRFNEETFTFDEYQLNNNGEIPTKVYPMWNDSSGRVYYGNEFMFNIDDDNKTVEMSQVYLGGDYQQNNSTIKSNIIEKDGVIYMISRRNACAYIFNEETQSFDSSIPVRGRFPSNTFYRYLTEFEGHWIFDAGQEQTELVFHFEAEPYAEWVTLSERLFPGAWSYEYEGQTINETTKGVYVHPVVKSGVTEYYTFGNVNPVMYKLVNGAWEIVGYNQTISDMVTNECGCAYGTLWFGFGYLNDMPNHLIIWNMDDSIAGKPEFYGWYDLDSEIEGIRGNVEGLLNSMNGIYNDINRINGDLSNLDSRISALETNYGDALNITNQILG